MAGLRPYLDVNKSPKQFGITHDVNPFGVGGDFLAMMPVATPFNHVRDALVSALNIGEDADVLLDEAGPNNADQGKIALAWAKVYLEGDSRFKVWLDQHNQPATAAIAKYSGWRGNVQDVDLEPAFHYIPNAFVKYQRTWSKWE